MSVRFTRFTAALAAAVLLLAACGLLFNPEQRAIASFWRGFESGAPKSAVVLKRDFPEVAAGLEVKIAAWAKTRPSAEPTRQEIQAMLGPVFLQLRPELRRAPAAELAAVVRTQLAVMQALRSVKPAACAAISFGGDTSFSTVDNPALAAVADDNLVAILNAVSAGRRTPVTHAAVTPEEQSKLAEAFRANADEPWFDRINGPVGPLSLAPPERCEAAIGLQKAILTQPDALIAKVMAEAMREAAEVTP